MTEKTPWHPQRTWWRRVVFVFSELVGRRSRKKPGVSCKRLPARFECLGSRPSSSAGDVAHSDPQVCPSNGTPCSMRLIASRRSGTLRTMRSTCASASAGFQPANSWGGVQLYVSSRCAWKCITRDAADAENGGRHRPLQPCAWEPRIGSPVPLELEIDEVCRNHDFPLRVAFHVVRASGRGLRAIGNSGWVCSIPASPAGCAPASWESPASRKFRRAFSALGWACARASGSGGSPKKICECDVGDPCTLDTRIRRTSPALCFRTTGKKIRGFRCGPSLCSLRHVPSPEATPRGFEPLRAEPNGFRVHPLSRSDTVSCLPSSPWGQILCPCAHRTLHGPRGPMTWNTRGGTRTHNLLLRREAPYPLGHTSSCPSLVR